ncbi:hypothetical protein, partial [Vibrio alginolyticus]|uniref:hypothetical protein n=1 Tax=Vibrio alginolyticus TaxID=663 RepID=UPI00301B7A94
ALAICPGGGARYHGENSIFSSPRNDGYWPKSGAGWFDDGASCPIKLHHSEASIGYATRWPAGDPTSGVQPDSVSFAG